MNNLNWTYNGRVIDINSPEVVLYHGFVYMLTFQTLNGLKYYIGKKMFQGGKDWLNYYGTSKYILTEYKCISREIISFHYTEKELEKSERQLQINNDVLKDDKFINRHIQGIGFNQTGAKAWNKGKTGIYSEEILKKMSDSSKGRKVSKKTREKISKAGIGRKHTEESKKLMSQNMKGKNKGKKQSKEHIQKKIEAQQILTNKQVLEIRSYPYYYGLYSELGRKFSINRDVIRKCHQGLTYQYIK